MSVSSPRRATRFHVTPDANAPGAQGIQHAINVFAVYALMAAAAGFLLGAATWAIGGRVGNEFTAVGGKLGMVTSLAVAFPGRLRRRRS